MAEHHGGEDMAEQSDWLNGSLEAKNEEGPESQYSFRDMAPVTFLHPEPTSRFHHLPEMPQDAKQDLLCTGLWERSETQTMTPSLASTCMFISLVI